MTSENLSKVECSIDEVECYLNKLDTNKSPDPDNISPHILKRCSKQLAPSSASLFNDFFATGTLPQDWKIANISPIHRRNSKFCKENYRQIFLTSIISKITEKIVHDRCIQFWIDHQVFCDQQFGFRRNKSTLSQLLLCFNDWAESRSNRYATDVIFLDFCKAFDSVPHKRLLYKLECYGIDGELLEWFRHFLTNRQQQVIVWGLRSNWTRVKSGVPQGTILGPILFLVYINDLPSEIQSPIKFTNDTKLYHKLINRVTDTNILQSDLNNIETWSDIWQLKFNSEKCETMR